jgi:acetate kinase
MNALVLIPGRNRLHYAHVTLGQGGTGSTSHARGTTSSVRDVKEVLATSDRNTAIDVISIRVIYGGLTFPSPVLLDDESHRQLLGLTSHAPLSVAKAAAVVDEARAVFPGTPIALAFETSFFVDLPARESTYALPSDIGGSIRRWGYHGLFHEAAVAQFERNLPHKRPARILSICLESTPELAAVIGRSPLMVTSGSTPIEGLPGEYNSGEIDPAIALALASDPTLGPERANVVLTQESGFFGMLGWPATLGEVLSLKRARIARVREHLLYRMLLAAGSGIAALEDIDGVVFSGRYAEQGSAVADYLVPRLERTLDRSPGSLPWQVCSTTLETIVAKAGVSALLRSDDSWSLDRNLTDRQGPVPGGRPGHGGCTDLPA